MDEGEGDQGEGEEATGLEGSNQGQDAAELHGGEKKIQKRKSVVAETKSGQPSKKGKRGDVVTQMRPDKTALGRLKRGLHNPTVRPKRLTKRQRKEAGRPDDDDAYGCREGPGPRTTWDPFGDGNADATRRQAEAEVRAREVARDLELDPGAGPKTKSSTSSSTPASPALPSPAISLVEIASDSPVELVTGPGGEVLTARQEADESSGNESGGRERGWRRGRRERDERAREEEEWEEDKAEDQVEGKEG